MWSFYLEFKEPDGLIFKINFDGEYDISDKEVFYITKLFYEIYNNYSEQGSENYLMSIYFLKGNKKIVERDKLKVVISYEDKDLGDLYNKYFRSEIRFEFWCNIRGYRRNEYILRNIIKGMENIYKKISRIRVGYRVAID